MRAIPSSIPICVPRPMGSPARALPGFAGITTGTLFGPEEALRAGYPDRILAPDQLDRAVQEEACRLRALDMASFAATKARINERALHAIRAAVDDEMRAVAA